VDDWPLAAILISPACVVALCENLAACVPLAMASSWDPSVAERAQAVAAREARAAGLHWTFGPMLDIARDAR
jgi:beta-glucosidase-like glycosyl hydrolase